MSPDPHLWGRGDRRRRKLSEIPDGVLELIRRRDGPGCVECVRQGIERLRPADEPLEVDHRQPMVEGGDNRWENLQLLCRGHNAGRGARPLSGALPPWRRRQLADERARAAFQTPPGSG